LYCKGELLLSHGMYTHNSAGGSGGAAFFTPGSNVKAWQVLFAHNTATQYGGAISADYGTSLNITFSNFTGQCVCTALTIQSTALLLLLLLLLLASWTAVVFRFEGMLVSLYCIECHKYCYTRFFSKLVSVLQVLLHYYCY
jgi:predicted outer membrane repeat protein